MSNKISCLIVDDEAPAIKLIEKYCSMIDQLKVEYTCQSAVHAFDYLQNNSVDLIFLDIQMPVLNGIAFLKSIKNPPSIIITTAYREYAVEGYDLDIVDYLLKPIGFDRFLKAIDRYQNKKNTIVETTPKTATEDFVFFNVNKKHHKVMISDIIYVESLKDYSCIHTVQEKLVVKGNLGTTLKELPADRFIRIHRSFAIAFSALSSYSQTEVELNSLSLPLGKSYREDFLSRIKNA